jgi:hypothetical protein
VHLICTACIVYLFADGTTTITVHEIEDFPEFLLLLLGEVDRANRHALVVVMVMVVGNQKASTEDT